MSMKSFIQVAALLAIVIGGIFGVTLLTQYAGNKPADQQVVNGELLKFETTKAQWEPGDAMYPKEFERGNPGHFDYLASNANNKDVMLFLDSKTCKCTSVRVAILPADVSGKLKNMSSNKPVGGQLEPYVANANWKWLLQDKSRPAEPVTIPAAAGDTPQFAVVRLEWEAKDPQVTNIKVGMHGVLGGTTSYHELEVGFTIVPPILIGPDALNVGDLNQGENAEAVFYVWSATRDTFPAVTSMVAPDTCIQVSEPRRITGQELTELPAKLIADGAYSFQTRPKCAYEIKVAVAEQKGEHQLELGPLGRRIYVNRGEPGEVFTILTGTVRGPVKVGEPADHDRVDLRVFPAATGAPPRTVRITSTVPGMQLHVDHVKPDFLQVQLEEIKSAFSPPSWRLTVAVPPNAAAGPLANDSAIYLKTKDKSPRTIRIPVAGNASG
jgi:hypothetical protein